MKQGRIISWEKDRFLLAYTDEAGEDGLVYAQGRGVMRLKGDKLLVGDDVEFELDPQQEEARIVRLLPRKNQLSRPPLANVDQVACVETIQEPEISPLILDKRLVAIAHLQLPALIVFNKIDRVSDADLNHWVQVYRQAGYPVYPLNALTGQGTEPFRACLEGKVTALAGPSGAGKSTLIRFLTGEDLTIGELSQKTARGKQTTRKTSLFRLDGQSFIFDTPGFSSLDLADFASLQDLAACFPEMASRSGHCRFRNCSHRKEPDCPVVQAVDQGEISPSRYQSYLYFCRELEAKKPWN